jgi:hypothetical protein
MEDWNTIDSYSLEEPNEEYQIQTIIELIDGGDCNFDRIPNYLKRKDVYMKMVSKVEKSLLYISDDIIDLDICMEAVKHGYSLKNIPSEYITEEICKIGLKSYPFDYDCIPKELKTRELYLYLFDCIIEYEKLHGNMGHRFLPHVPKELIDKELALITIKRNNNEFEDVPNEIMDIELCREAFKGKFNSNLYNCVPNHLKVEEISLIAAKRSFDAFMDLPKSLITKELCLKAIRNYRLRIECIPKELLCEDIYLEYIEIDGNMIMDFPKDVITDLICIKAISRGVHISSIPPELIGDYICYPYVKNWGTNLKDIPLCFRTRELCKTAVKNHGKALLYTPKKFRDMELIIEAVKTYGMLLKVLPIEYKTKEVCEIAVEQNAEALKYVPQEIGKLILNEIIDY